MDIATEVSDVIARGEDDLPVVTRRVTQSTALVPDRGTVVISGLTDRRDRRAVRKMPILGHLPLIGRLFTSVETEKRDSQIAVFITPRITEASEPSPDAVQRVLGPLPEVGEGFDLELRALIEQRNGVGND
jgi:type II secretory pathway component GspD/PulD (secretin)